MSGLSARGITAIELLAAACGHLPGWLRPQPPESALSPELMAEARELYVRSCAPCHGPEGRGDGPEGAALRLPPADLTRMAVLHGGVFPREYFLDIVTGAIEVPAHGPRDMPVWRQRFGPGDSPPEAVAAVYAQRRLDLLAAYVESLQRPPAKKRKS